MHPVGSYCTNITRFTVHRTLKVQEWTGLYLREFYTKFGEVHPPRIQNFCEISNCYWKQDFTHSRSLLKNLNLLNEGK